MGRLLFTFFMALMTSLICGGMGGYLTYGIVRQAGTASWPSVTGRVTQSAVVTRRGSKGSVTYRPRVRYVYEVDGRSRTGDAVTLALSIGDSGGGYANRTVAEFPAGAQARVYYNPSDPGEAVLRCGMGSREWQVAALASALLSVPLIAWVVFAAGVLDRAERVGTVRVMEPAPGIAVVRATRFGAVGAGAVGWGIGQAVTLVTAVAVVESNVREWVLTGWGVSAALAAAGGVLRSRWLAAGRRDHVIDRNEGVVILARGVKREAEAVPLASITGTQVVQDSRVSTNKTPHWRVHLVVAGEAKTRPLVDIQREADARVFEGWLRERMGLEAGGS